MVSEENWYLWEEVGGARNAKCVGKYKRQLFSSLIFFKGKLTFKIKIIIQLTLEQCKGQGLQTAHTVGNLSITEDGLLHMWNSNHKLNLEQYKLELLESTEKNLCISGPMNSNLHCLRVNYILLWGLGQM